MIIHLTHGTPDIALRIMNSNDSQLMDWHNIVLYINKNNKKCGVGGSPWYFYGCWPCHKTGVDIANPPPREYPSIVIPAEGIDYEGRIIFHIGDSIRNVYPGRYNGELIYSPHVKLKHRNISMMKVHTKDKRPIIPDKYIVGVDCNNDQEDKPNRKPHNKHCIISRFDIDIGYPCYSNIITEASINLSEGCGYTEEGI